MADRPVCVVAVVVYCCCREIRGCHFLVWVKGSTLTVKITTGHLY